MKFNCKCSFQFLPKKTHLLETSHGRKKSCCRYLNKENNNKDNLMVKLKGRWKKIVDSYCIINISLFLRILHTKIIPFECITVFLIHFILFHVRCASIAHKKFPHFNALSTFSNTFLYCWKCDFVRSCGFRKPWIGIFCWYINTIFSVSPFSSDEVRNGFFLYHLHIGLTWQHHQISHYMLFPL